MANFTPELQTYTKPGKFKYSCQKVLPLVYDDSLSYYELLNKVVSYINYLIQYNGSIFVTPQMYGAKADGTTDDTSAVVSALNNADCIFFPSGTYYIGSNINLASLNGKWIVGVPGKSILLFDDGTTDSTSGSYNYMFSLTKCSDFVIDGITFDYVPNGSNSYNNVLVNIDCSQKIAFSNCEFYSDKDNGGLYHNCTCVWIRKTGTIIGNNSKISFDCCDFVNHSGANEGGCLWIVSPMDSVVMNKCYVSHCTTDEAVVSWVTEGGVLEITDSYLELVKLNITPNQLIGAWRDGKVSVKGCYLFSGEGLGAYSFIRAHDNGTITLADTFIKVDACYNMYVFKTQAERSTILLSNCTVEAIASTTSSTQRIYEGMGTEGVFKATNCLFRLGKSASDPTIPFYVMVSAGGTISLTGCSFETVNPENFKELSFHFGDATDIIKWSAVGNTFIGSGAIGMGGLANLSIASAGNNRNTPAFTFNSTAESAFA